MPMSATTMPGFSIGMRAQSAPPSPTVSTCMSSPANVISMTRWIVALSSARSSFLGIRALLSGVRVSALRDEVDDVLHRGAWQEYALDADGVQLRNVHVGNDAADHDEHV